MSRICLDNLDKMSIFDDSNRKRNGTLGIEYISFSGGGAKGVCYAGIISSLRKHGVLNEIKAVSGTSIGAIACLFATCGLEDKEIYKFAANMDKWKIFKNAPNIGLVNCFRMYKNLGINDSRNLYKLIGDVLEAACMKRTITLKEYTEKTNKRMIITSTAIETVETIYFHDKTYPDVEVAFAIMVSMLLPFVYMPVNLKDRFAYKGTRMLIDGGVFNNYPVRLFDYYDKNEHLVAINRKTLVILLLNNGQSEDVLNDVKGIENLSTNIINGYYTRLHKEYTKDEYFWARSIIIECGNVISNRLELNGQEANELITVGKVAMDKYLNNRKEEIKEHGGFPVETFIRSKRARFCNVKVTNNDMKYTLSENKNPQRCDDCTFHHNYGYL